MGYEMRSTPSWTQPNKRLKLPGGDRFKGTLSVVPWRARSIVQLDGALRAGRPQLKRDPLGGALPPHKHSSVNSFLYGDSAGRRAPMLPREDLFAAPHHAKAAAQACRAAHLASGGWLPTGNFPTQGRARAPSDARRARASVQGAPSNMRLELAAPGGQGRIPFVTNQARRRSSSAIR